MRDLNSDVPIRGRNRLVGPTDDELVAYEFYTADPSKLSDLLDAVPQTAEVPDVEFSYDTRGRGMVRCVHCKKVAANHYRGFVLRFSDGKRMLFGQDCGEKQYGLEFKESRSDFERMSRRAALLKRRRHILENRSALSDLYDLILAHPSWRQYESLRRGVIAILPDLISQIGEAVRFNDGVLKATTMVPDRERAEDLSERAGRQVGSFVEVEVPVHALQGKSLFAGGPVRSTGISDLCRRARGTVWNIGEPERDREIELVLRNLDEISEKLAEAAVQVTDLAAALSQDNISGIDRWMGRLPPGVGRLRIEGRRLYRCNSKGQVHMLPLVGGGLFAGLVQLPTELPKPPGEAIAEIRAILGWRPS